MTPGQAWASVGCPALQGTQAESTKTLLSGDLGAHHPQAESQLEEYCYPVSIYDNSAIHIRLLTTALGVWRDSNI